MRIGLIDVDSHNFPNLALMKLSAYHKARGDSVEWWNGFKGYDIVYKSRVFDDTYSEDVDYCINADKVVKGGTGYDLENKLPDEIEHTFPDYGLYGIRDRAYGFLTRGCFRNCPFCIVTQKEGTTHTVADLSEFWNGQKEIVVMDSNITASKDCERLFRQLADSKAQVNFEGGLDIRLMDEAKTKLLNRIKVKEIHFAWDRCDDDSIVEHFERYRKTAKHKPHGFYASVYVLTNYDTTLRQDLARIDTLRGLGYDPYVMVFDKPNAPEEIRLLQRWCNNKRIFRSCEFFDDYNRRLG